MKTYLLGLRGAGAAAAAFLLCIAFSPRAAAQLIVNGGFEAGSPGYGGVNTVVNQGVVSGWTVITLSGTSELGVFKPSALPLPIPNDLGANVPAAVEGVQYLAFNTRGQPAGTITIYQDFTTTPGTDYEVFFTVGATSDPSISEPLNQPVSLKAETFNVVSGTTSGGALGLFTLDPTTASGSTGEFFDQSSFSFTATGTTTRLIFTDLTFSTANVDALLDGISVQAASAVPEPATYAAIVGAAMLGLAAWRRRKSGAAVALAV